MRIIEMLLKVFTFASPVPADEAAMQADFMFAVATGHSL